MAELTMEQTFVNPVQRTAFIDAELRIKGPGRGLNYRCCVSSGRTQEGGEMR